MMSLSSLLSSRQRQAPVPKWLAVSFAVIALLGFADASFLTVEHYRGTPPPCFIVAGCASVTSSRYSEIWGIPVALPGALYYLTLLTLMVRYLESQRPTVAWLAFQLTPFGLLAALYFVYLQMNVINAWCLYCLGSAASSTLLFFLAAIGVRYSKIPKN